MDGSEELIMLKDPAAFNIVSERLKGSPGAEKK
jgi:hypothetical protein